MHCKKQEADSPKTFHRMHKRILMYAYTCTEKRTNLNLLRTYTHYMHCKKAPRSQGMR